MNCEQIIKNIEDSVALAKLTAIEAAFDLDPFDREAQKDFEEALEKI